MMRNVFIEKMRKVLEAYLQLQNLTNNEIAKNIDTYTPELSDKYNKELRAKKVKDYKDAKAEITKIFDKVRELLAKASYPISNEMTADADLFTNPYIKLTNEEIEAMANKYRESGNYTMLRLLSNWCEEHDKHYLDLYLPHDQLIAYQELANSAMYTVNGIFSEDRNHFLDLEIEHFADPIMCKNQLKAIGTGKGLKRFESKEVPESILHRFDGVVLKDEDLTSVATGFIDNNYTDANTEHIYSVETL